MQFPFLGYIFSLFSTDYLLILFSLKNNLLLLVRILYVRTSSLNIKFILSIYLIFLSHLYIWLSIMQIQAIHGFPTKGTKASVMKRSRFILFLSITSTPSGKVVCQYAFVSTSNYVGHTSSPLLHSHSYKPTPSSQRRRWELLMVTRIKRRCHPNYFLSEFNNKHVTKSDCETSTTSGRKKRL